MTTETQKYRAKVVIRNLFGDVIGVETIDITPAINSFETVEQEITKQLETLKAEIVEIRKVY